MLALPTNKQPAGEILRNCGWNFFRRTWSWVAVLLLSPVAPAWGQDASDNSASAKADASPQKTDLQDAESSGRDWSMFRGDPLANGNSKSSLPDKLELLWTFKVPKGAFESTAAIVNGVVYIGDLDGRVYALDLENGQKKWEFKTESGFSASPAVRNGLIFIGDYDGTFYCIDDRGELKWKFATDAEINSSANFYKDQVLFGSQDATLYCLDMQSGKLTWKFQIMDQIRCSPTVVENRCFVAGCDARLHIVDLDKGEGITAVDIDGPTMVTPAVVGDHTYFGTEQGTAFAINWKEAKKSWDVKVDDRGDSVRSSPAITKIDSRSAMIFGTRSKKVHALDLANGHPIWEFTTKSMVDSSPVIAGGRAFFGTDRGQLMAVNTADGSLAWETDLGGTIAASPAIASQRLVIANDRGNVFCFGKKN